MRYIFTIFLLCFSLFANNDFVSEESSVFDSVENQLQQKTSEVENTQENFFKKVDTNLELISKNLYLSYNKFPKNIYKNQRFEIVLKALITRSDYDRIETRFVDSKNMTVLNPQEPWMAIDTNSFENKYFFKAYEEDFTLPTFQVLLYKDEQLVEYAYLKPNETRFIKLGVEKKEFSNVIANDFIVNTYKTKQYNNKEFLTIIDIDANYSNLEDFYLKNLSKEQGISQIEDDYPKQHILYYVVSPIHEKNIRFSYFNNIKNKYEFITIPIKLENELISTQTDLNPSNSNFEFYKKIAVLSLLALFLILFLIKRKYSYLVVVLILAIISILYYMPNKKRLVKKDTLVHILPTNKSTVFYKIKTTKAVEVMNIKDGFVKIMINNDKKIIGWIKEENVIKN